VMVLAVPAAWMHYSTITILPFVALLWHAATRPVTIRQAALLAIAFGLIAYGNQWTFFIGTRNPGLPELALSFKGYGLAILWGLVVTAILQARASRSAVAERTDEPGRQPARGYEPAAGVS
jgi:hypothetical protein